MSEKYFWMPCLLNKNPAAVVFPTERAIHYWLPDRCGQYWAIVRARNVLEGRECVSRGNELNPDLIPAFFFVRKFVPLRGSSEYCLVFLGDLDGKWIRLCKTDLFRLTHDEAINHLRDAEWTKEVFGERLKARDESGSTVLSLRTGLLELRTPKTGGDA